MCGGHRLNQLEFEVSGEARSSTSAFYTNLYELILVESVSKSSCNGDQKRLTQRVDNTEMVPDTLGMGRESLKIKRQTKKNPPTP